MTDTPRDFFDKAKQANKEAANQTPIFEFKDEGDLLQGVFIKAEYVMTRTGGTYLVIVKPLEMDLEADQTDDNGYVAFWAGTTLKRQLFDILPKPGSLILVEYVEEKESEANPGRTYKLFGVQAQDSDPAYWSNLATKAKTKKTLSDAAESTEAAANALDESPF